MWRRIRTAAAATLAVFALAAGVMVWNPLAASSVEQACPSAATTGTCTPIPAGPHPAEGTPIVGLADIRARVDALPVYPNSSDMAYRDEYPEAAHRWNNLVGFTGARSTKSMRVGVATTLLLSWYREHMAAAGWTAALATYRRPQETSLTFTRGVRSTVTLSVHAASGAEARLLAYDLVVEVAPYHCNGLSSCGYLWPPPVLGR